MVRPCVEGSDELVDATRNFEALGTRIRALQPADDHRAINAALVALAAHPCLALSNVDPGELQAEAAPALTDFWNHGGEIWVQEQLQMARVGVLAFPPLMRKVISPRTRAGHPAIQLMCALEDSVCGQETAGWWQRAESYFRLNARTNPRGLQVPVATERDCRAEALAEPADQQFGAWAQCVRSLRRIGFAMPLGRLRSPASGWLVIRGRRGHYAYCDEVRMYSLASGAAYSSQSCSALHLGDGPRPERTWKVERGSMSLDNLREFAWMLLQLDEAAEGFRNFDTFALRGIEAVKKRDESANSPGSAKEEKEITVSSAQTTLAWAWVDAAGKELTGGTLRWPTDYLSGPADYALELLRVAEAGFLEGCPGESLPQDIVLGKARPVVSPLDANPRELNQVERDLVAVLHDTARTECRVRR
jgi:hypothetical protein